jgi:hypothetical protein
MRPHKTALTLYLLLTLATVVVPLVGYMGSLVVYADFKESFTYPTFNNETETYHVLDEARFDYTMTLTNELLWNSTTSAPSAKVWLAPTDNSTLNTNILSFNTHPITGGLTGFELYMGTKGGTWSKLIEGNQTASESYILTLDDEGDLYVGNSTDIDVHGGPVAYGTTKELEYVGLLGNNDTATGGYYTVEVVDYSADLTTSMSTSITLLVGPIISLSMFGIVLSQLKKV